MTMKVLGAAVMAVVWVAALQPHEARACGCFASVTTAATPVVQAGERIVFAQSGNHVTAVVQIQYQGEAGDFEWIVPLPSVPNVKAGSDELFGVLDAATRPQFLLTTTTPPACRPSRGVSFGCAGSSAVLDRQPPSPVGSSPLVLRDTTGPYDYAVLKADSKADLLQWLTDNRFVVPNATEASLAPYIHPGAFFLALKLRSGLTAGDLRPIVLDYVSDYPMIPLILTSATSVPHLAVEVFVLGAARAIPRNYHHVEPNLFKLDWYGAGNYLELITAAVAEAPRKHAFVTEYAGPSAIARNVMVPQGSGRFGTRAMLEAAATPSDFLSVLTTNGYADPATAEFPSALLAALDTQLPYPPKLRSFGISATQFYRRFEEFTALSYRSEHPEVFAQWPGLSFEAATLSEAVWTAVAQPVLDAEAMLAAHSTLTRLFTVISPEDMTEDPVFGFNATLGGVGVLHEATQNTGCRGVDDAFQLGSVVLPRNTSAEGEAAIAAMPAARTIAVLREEGPAEALFQYEPAFPAPRESQGCASASGAWGLALTAAVLLSLRRRRLS